MWRSLCLGLSMLLAGGAFAAPNAKIIEITEQQRDILNEVMRIDGELTEDMHRRFWADMPSPRPDPKQWAITRRQLEGTFELDLNRMRAMYLSMRATLKHHAPTVDPSYAKAQAAFEAISVEDPADNARLQLKLALEDRLFHQQLEAIARGEPLKRGDEDIVMTPELVAEVLDGLDETYRRAARLLDPVWRSK
ncbi:MAG TPA: hypothetical protein VFB32_05400 [Rudaea sp.]|nr:hypothetical protein [Rudaea sp.]